MPSSRYTKYAAVKVVDTIFYIIFLNVILPAPNMFGSITRKNMHLFDHYQSEVNSVLIIS